LLASQRPKLTGYFYYKLEGWIDYKTTKTKKHLDALRVVQKAIADASKGKRDGRTFAQYAEPFFLWDSCPHVRRLVEEGKSITRRHCKMQRGWLTRFVLGTDDNEPDALARLSIAKIKRSDLLAFRTRLMAKMPGQTNTVNKVLAVVKTIFKEALYHEDIDRDPTAGIGNVHEDRTEAGTFAADELLALFPTEGFGPWQDRRDYTMFLLAASTGMRRGEILALRWRAVDFGAGLVTIDEAWKGGDEIGTPKWGRKRKAGLPGAASRSLRALWDESKHNGAEDFVFCDSVGQRLGETYWTQHFAAGMKAAKIDARGRNIKAHSFRHSLNTLLVGGGIDREKIRAGLGWSGPRIQENYTHWGDDSLKEVSRFVDENIFQIEKVGRG
jgi:integrase